MTTRLTFQQAIMRLEQFWSDHGCLIWQPYNVQVGAGTMNPATSLRVLGPEPWRVAYVEPSIRPDDSRYGQNPNRMQRHYQYQVVLKPDPGNAQELYLQSLGALGIERRENDIRFVEDNWESPALGAWGLGWEVWLNGQEITQFTYFQQAGGITLDPLAVEITYGLERILMALQDVRSFADIWWNESIKYGDLLLQAEIEHSRYNLDCADVKLLARFFADYEREARQCLRQRLVVPAFDYILKCSHTFNVLDARGAIGVTERAHYFARMRNLTHEVAEMYLKQREESGYPLLHAWEEPVSAASPAPPAVDAVDEPADLVLEIGTEELPVADLASAIEQLHAKAHEMFEGLRLTHGPLKVVGTPRHLALCVEGLAARQTDRETVAKGPPAAVAYDQEGRPTKAAQGFARSVGVPVEWLQTQHVNGRPYVVAVLREEGRPAIEILRERLPELIASLRFPLTMRWNQTQVAFPRPIRWLVALLGPAVIEFEYAGVTSGRTTRGLRPMGDPEIVLPHARDYLPRLREQGIVLDHLERRAMIESQIAALAGEVGGRVPEDEALLIEVTNLVEAPTSLRGSFDPEFLELPEEVLITVMQKHQRYFPIVDSGTGRLLPYFIAVRNGDGEHLDIVRKGNEEVLRARYTDAVFFFREDVRRPLEDYLPRLETLTFQEKLGSVLDKVRRLEELVPELARLLNVSDAELASARRAAHLSKADLATQMVIEFTSLQGVMGREYALRSGEAPEVAQALFEHYLPRYAGDVVPRTMSGVLVAVADRLDSLAGLFAVGLAPTGAADPYGLRRAALGLVQILVENGLSFSLRQGLELAGGLLPVEVPPAAVDDAVSFIEGRLRVWLREKGFRYDVVEAVLKARGDNPYMAHESAAMLQKWVEREDWPSVLNAYGRCYRIVREFDERFPIDPAAFTENSSKRLYSAYLACRERVDGDATVDELLAAFVPMIQPINVFFDEVLVMDPDPALRQNRLGLLQRIAALADGIVDLSQLEGF